MGNPKRGTGGAGGAFWVHPPLTNKIAVFLDVVVHGIVVVPSVVIIHVVVIHVIVIVIHVVIIQVGVVIHVVVDISV